jgi:hypothetical protein
MLGGLLVSNLGIYRKRGSWNVSFSYNRKTEKQLKQIGCPYIIIIILTANGFLPGGSGITIRRNTQITHITQNNTPHSNKTQHTKLHKQ